MFAAVCEEIAAILRVEAASVLRFASEHRAVVVGVWREGGSHGLPVNAELDFDARNSALGRVAAGGRPARMDGYAGAPGELPRLMEAIEIRASAAAPIHVDGRVWGAVVAARTRDEPLPGGVEERLVPFADLVGQTLANAQARRRMAESADESRRRLERGLHAGARQHLLALKLKLRLARDRARTGADVGPLLADALAEAEAADASLRELAQDVHPAVLEERGLAAALQGLAAKADVRVLLRALPGAPLRVGRRDHGLPGRRRGARQRRRPRARDDGDGSARGSRRPPGRRSRRRRHRRRGPLRRGPARAGRPRGRRRRPPCHRLAAR